MTNAHLASSAVSQKHGTYKKGLVINAIDLTDDAKELFKTDLEGRVGVNEDATEKKFKIETPELQDSTASDQGAPPPAPPQPPAQQPNANAPPPGQSVGSGLIIFRSCPPVPMEVDASTTSGTSDPPKQPEDTAGGAANGEGEPPEVPPPRLTPSHSSAHPLCFWLVRRR